MCHCILMVCTTNSLTAHHHGVRNQPLTSSGEEGEEEVDVPLHPHGVQPTPSQRIIMVCATNPEQDL
jgi:hypothetical protein